MSKNKTKVSKKEEDDFDLDLNSSEDESKNSKASESEEDTKPAPKNKKAAKKKIDSDDEDNITVKKTKKGSKSKEDDSDEEAAPKKKKKASDDSDEEAVPKKKKASDDSDEEAVPKKKKKASDDSSENKKSKSKSKKTEDSENSEESKKVHVETSSYQRKKATMPVYRYNDIKFENLTTSKFNEEMKSAWIRYTDDKLKAENVALIQSGYITLEGGGTPKLDTDRKSPFYPTDDKREFTRIPLDPAQKECLRLRKFLEEADAHFDTVAFRKSVFGDNHNKYVYTSLITPPWDGGGADDKKNSFPKHDRIKLKFAAMFVDKNGHKCKKEGDGATRRITVKLLRRKDKTKGGDMTRVKATTVPQIVNEIRPGTETRFVFTFDRLYVSPIGIANQNAKKDKDAPKKLYPYGIHLKVMVFEYIPRASVSMSPDDVDFVSYGEDDDESEDDGKQKKSKSKDADDEEQEVAPSGKSKDKKKPVSSSESESEEVKPKKKATKSRNKDDE